ncbi:MAG TPA: hypothetical protein VF816_14695 [Rhodocyclaceae bacterium]
MEFGNQRAEAARAGQELAGHYQSMLDGWAEVSRCCMAAADDIYRTSLDFVRDQAEQLQEISRDPGAAMREQTVSRAINCSFDAADRIAQAYLHSLETVREPLMRAVSAQLPMTRTMSSFMEKGMRGSMEAIEQGTDEMTQGVRSAARSAERGAQEAQQRQQQGHQQGRRKSA